MHCTNLKSGAFSKTPNSKLSKVLIVHVFTLFNLQGTPSALRGGFSLYHTLFSLSRTFFKFFQSFQSRSFRKPLVPATSFAALSSCRPWRGTFLVYHKNPALSRTFFTFFNVFCSRLSCFVAPQQVPAYNTKAIPECQHFFSIFSKFFSTYNR